MDTEQLNRALDSTRAVLATVQPGQLTAPTPCVSWDVRALIDHFTGSVRWATATITAEAITGEATITGGAAGDFLAVYDVAIRSALVAFGADGALTRTLSLPFGQFSGADLLELVAREQFIHGWDLAKAIGYHTELGPALASELLAGARTAGLDAFRGADGVAFFGPAVVPPPGAGPADQLAAFLGRQV